MLITHDKIIGLEMVTESGEKLGTVSALDIDVDVEDQNIIYYHVKSLGLIRGLFKQELMVHRSQIVAFETDRVVVVDNVYKEAVVGDKPVKIGTQLEKEAPTLSVKD